MEERGKTEGGREGEREKRQGRGNRNILKEGGREGGREGRYLKS